LKGILQMKRIGVLLIGVASLILMTQCKSSTPDSRESKPAQAATQTNVTEIASPAGSGSAEPNLSTGPDGRVYLSWIDAADTTSSLKFSILGENQTWSPAGLVAQGEHWFVNSADYPSLIALPDGTLAAHWLADNPEGSEAYNIHLAMSHDGGKTWSKPIIPHRDRSENEHGFASLIAAGPAELGILWLDGNKIKDEVGDMALNYTTVGADGKIGKETVLDSRVCECCQTSAAATPDGIIAVYRDRSEKEIRDIAYALHTKDGWSKPEALSKDNWHIDGCPVNGPSVSTSGSQAAAAWFTAPNDVSQVNVALSSDGGKTFGPPIRVDNGKPVGRVDVIALSSGDALVSWLEQAAEGTQVRIRQVRSGGTLGDPIIASAKSKVKFAGVPQMTLSGKQVVVAWTDGETPSKVHTAAFKIE
jgi:BNR repeat-like domain